MRAHNGMDTNTLCFGRVGESVDLYDMVNISSITLLFSTLKIMRFVTFADEL